MTAPLSVWRKAGIIDETEDDDMAGVIDLQDYEAEQDDLDMEGVVDLQEYASSSEAQEASWKDLAKDVIVQPALGIAKAFTWPFDVLKIGMVGEALSDLDELEEAFKKEGKPFDRSKYLKSVAETSQFIPTQQLLEEYVTDKIGINLEPKTEIGKFINKFFTLASLTRGAGLGKAVSAGTVGAGTTAGLKAAGANEIVAELTGDLLAGGTAGLKKSARAFTPEVSALEKTAAKHGLPFPEYLTRDTAELIGPKISEARRMASQKELGMTTQEAIQDVISGKLPASKIRQQGGDLDVLVNDAYDNVKSLATSNTKTIPTNQVIDDINMEIARIRKNAPSPSDADMAAINILEREAQALESNPANTEQLVQQIKNYNQNVSQIYKRPEFSGREDAVRGAYAFLNNSIRNTIEQEAGTDVRQAMKAADSLFAEKSKLDRAEGMVSKAFKNGEYNPKKLSQVLTSREGQIVRRELGDQAINEIRDIAKYGEQAVKATNQLAKSKRHLGNIAEWGPIAGFLLSTMPKAGLLLAARSLSQRIRGYLMMRPATRKIYKDIMKNAANGAFKNMAADFDKIETEIAKDYGSVEEFMRSMIDELEIVGDED